MEGCMGTGLMRAHVKFINRPGRLPRYSVTTRTIIFCDNAFCILFYVRYGCQQFNRQADEIEKCVGIGVYIASADSGLTEYREQFMDGKQVLFDRSGLECQPASAGRD
jgi:hypothetical protein